MQSSTGMVADSYWKQREEIPRENTPAGKMTAHWPLSAMCMGSSDKKAGSLTTGNLMPQSDIEAIVFTTTDKSNSPHGGPLQVVVAFSGT